MDCKHALTVLTRLAARRPEKASILNHALKGRLNRLAPVAINVAIETGDPIGRVLASTLAKERNIAVAGRLFNLLPEPHGTVALQELGVAISALRALGQIKEIGNISTSDYPYILTNLAEWMNMTGNYESALAVSKEAINIFRPLVKQYPGKFLPDLAASLATLATILAGTGQSEKALNVAIEATQITSDLAKANPDKFNAGYAHSLNVLAHVLYDLGKYEEALAITGNATKIYRTLAKTSLNKFGSGLAYSLHNQAAILAALWQYDESLAAADEVVNIYRKLSETVLDYYLPTFPTVLSMFASALAQCNKLEHALSAATEAINISRTLTVTRPSFRPVLAESLKTFVKIAIPGGRLPMAVGFTKEFIARYRELAEKNPKLFLEVEQTAKELVTHYRALAEENPTLFLSDLAGGLKLYGDILKASHKHRKARPILKEANDLYLKILSRDPAKDSTKPNISVNDSENACPRPNDDLLGRIDAVLDTLDRGVERGGGQQTP